jgi:hypothetical protein
MPWREYSVKLAGMQEKTGTTPGVHGYFSSLLLNAKPASAALTPIAIDIASRAGV